MNHSYPWLSPDIPTFLSKFQDFSLTGKSGLIFPCFPVSVGALSDTWRVLFTQRLQWLPQTFYSPKTFPPKMCHNVFNNGNKITERRFVSLLNITDTTYLQIPRTSMVFITDFSKISQNIIWSQCQGHRFCLIPGIYLAFQLDNF